MPPRCDPDTGIILRIWASPFVSPCFTYFASALASTLAQTLHLSRVRLLFRTPVQLVGQICSFLKAALPAAANKWGQEARERSLLSAFHQGSIVRRDCVGTPRLLAAAGVIELKGFAAAHIPSPPCT